MIFGFDYSVGGGAFAGDVAVREISLGLVGRRGRGMYRSTSSPFSFSIFGGRWVVLGWCGCGWDFDVLGRGVWCKRVLCVVIA